MRVALLFPNNLFTSPYLKYYTDILKQEKIEYDLLIWDRANIEEDDCIAFRSKKKSSSATSKILEFLGFRRFLVKNLKDKDYSKIIVFSCQLGILISDVLIKKYSKKYILDIRDYSNTNKYFKNRFKRLISNSAFTCISSNGFKNWLPCNTNYVLSHNLDIKLLYKHHLENDNRKVFFSRKTLNVDTIGAIRDVNSNTSFVNSLKNKDQYFMNFYGMGYAIPYLKENQKKNDINNIIFHGLYDKEEEEDLLKNTDFINILLDDNLLSQSLTSNRLYLSALYHIPCIVNKNTEQSRIIEKYNFGIVVDKYEELPNKLELYKQNFRKEKFLKNCNAFLHDVKKDYAFFEQKVTNFLTDK